MCSLIWFRMWRGTVINSHVFGIISLDTNGSDMRVKLENWSQYFVMYHVFSLTAGAIFQSPCLSARMSHEAVDEIYNFFVTIVMYDFRFWNMNGQKIGLRLSVISLARVKQMRLCVKITWWFSNFSGKYRYYNNSSSRRRMSQSSLSEKKT